MTTKFNVRPASNVAAYQCVVLGSVPGETGNDIALANANTAAHKFDTIGITTGEGLTGGLGGSVILEGIVENLAWDWTLNQEIYVSESTPGALTQTRPTSGFVRVIATVITPTVIWFRPTQIVVPDGGVVGGPNGAGPGQWERIGSTVTASSQASVDVVLPTGYDEYRLRFYNLLPVTNDVSLRSRLSNDGGSTFIATADYRYVTFQDDNAAASESEVSFGQTFWEVCESTAINRGVGNVANTEGISGVLRVWNAHSTTLQTRYQGECQYTSAANTEWIVRTGGKNDLQEKHDAIQVFFQSGNIVSGTVQLEGLMT